MLLLTIAVTAALIGAVVVGDHVLEIKRPRIHMLFLYASMSVLLFATVSAQSTGSIT